MKLYIDNREPKDIIDIIGMFLLGFDEYSMYGFCYPNFNNNNIFDMYAIDDNNATGEFKFTFENDTQIDAINKVFENSIKNVVPYPDDVSKNMRPP